MWTTVKYVFLTAVRDWLFIGLFAAIVFAAGVSMFLGHTALSEQQQMTIAYVAASARAILLIGMIVFVCFHVRRAFDQREIEVILTRPISRSSFVLAYWAGFTLIALLAIIPVSILILSTLDVDMLGWAIWSLSLFCEATLVIAFALAASLILRSAVSSVLISFGFYLISRLMGFFTAVIDKPDTVRDFSLNYMVETMIKLASMILPRLDLYSGSKWLIYGPHSDVYLWWEWAEFIPVFVAQSLVFVPLLLAMAIYDFTRKQF